MDISGDFGRGGARHGFTIRLKRLKPKAPDFWGPQNFGSKDNFQRFCKQLYTYNFICICSFVLVQRTFFAMPLTKNLYRLEE